MLAKSFLAHVASASVPERVEAVRLLAAAYLGGIYGDDDPARIEAALTFILDDSAVPVRRALALALAERADAPRHIVLALAQDVADVGAPLIVRSPLLMEADLLEIARMAEGLTLAAIALRTDVTPAIAHAVVRRGDRRADLALIGNRRTEIAEVDIMTIVREFGSDPAIREAMIARADLPAPARHALMVGLAETLTGFARGGGFLAPRRSARLAEEVIQASTLAIARRSGEEIAGFVAYLRENAQLTPALLLRAVLGGDLALLAAALAELTAMEHARVDAILRARGDAARIALMRRAGLPAYLVPVLSCAVRAAVEHGAETDGALRLPVIRAAEAACLAGRSEEGLRLLALLRRYAAEAARGEARRLVERLIGETRDAASSLTPPDTGPELLRLAEPPGAGEAADRRILRARGLVLDEPIPDLRSIIDAWKAERVAENRNAAKPAPAVNANEKPGQSRAA